MDVWAFNTQPSWPLVHTGAGGSSFILVHRQCAGRRDLHRRDGRPNTPPPPSSLPERHQERQSLWSFLSPSHIIKGILFLYLLLLSQGSSCLRPFLDHRWSVRMVVRPLWKHWGISLHCLFMSLWHQVLKWRLSHTPAQGPGGGGQWGPKVLLTPCVSGRPGLLQQTPQLRWHAFIPHSSGGWKSRMEVPGDPLQERAGSWLGGGLLLAASSPLPFLCVQGQSHLGGVFLFL